MQAKKILGIIVKPENKGRIEAALEAVQGQAHTRTVTYEDIAKELEDVENWFAIPKTALKGVKVSIDKHAQTFPHAYKGRPESTQVGAIYTGTAWKITDIRRGYTRAKGHVVESLELPEKAIEEVLKQYQVLW
jgi:uncharacterized protein with von Willebrand factor type A (vWA) domain